MPSLSVTQKRRRDGTKSKFKVMGNHNEFISRIQKTLYYGKLPTIETFSLPVTELAAELFSEVKNGQSLDRLDLEQAAAITRNACVSPCSLVLALLYLERLKTCNPDYLHRVAPSELFLVSMLVASKFLNDDGEADEVFNDEWAASAGVSVKEINRFERDFLQAIEWEVFVSEGAFWTRLNRIERDIALKEGKRRGWFSYTDLENLLDTVDLTALAQAVITVSAVCLTSYTASVLTLIGSAFIVSQIPGSSISTSVSPTCDVQRNVLQETSVANTLDQPASQTLPSVNVLTTSLILASLSSCPSENSSKTSGISCNYSKNALCHCQHYPMKRSGSFVAHGEKEWAELGLEWLKYITWEWWKMELQHLLSTSPQLNTTKANSQRVHKSDDTVNHSGLNAHSKRIEQQNVQTDSQEWIAEIRSWLDQTALERNSQSKFFPLEIAASNY